jgi:RNA 2',3'-cyclic 3'-phosphodiesterase
MRLFAGVELDEATRSSCSLVQEALRAAHFQARYEAPEKLHLTIAFLGSVNVEKLADVEGALGQVAVSHRRLEIEFNRVGAFPHARRPRIVYLGSYDAGPEYRALAGALRGAYAGLGFSFDEDAVAHVTIARVKGGSLRPLPQLEPQPVILGVSEIVLFESLPHEGSTRYVVRSRADLGKAFKPSVNANE